jgi:hypothetical protein
MEDGEWILHNEYKKNIRMKNWNSSGKELVIYSYINIYLSWVSAHNPLSNVQ